MNWTAWIWGSPAAEIPNYTVEELFDDFLILEKEEEEELLTESLVERTNFFSKPDSDRIYRLLSTYTQKEFQSGMNPYDCALISEVDRKPCWLAKTHYFLDSQLLAARGANQKRVALSLLSGKVAECSTQTLLDLHRWSEESYLGIDDEILGLKPSEEHKKISVEIAKERKVPLYLFQLIDRIDQLTAGDSGLFSYIMDFLNQGPLNDMLYDMMASTGEEWNATLIPGSSKKRTFYLITEKERGKSVAKQLLIAIEGFFTCGSLPGMEEYRTLEEVEGQPLGRYYGVTAVNLENRTAFVHTEIEKYPDVWDRRIQEVAQKAIDPAPAPCYIGPQKPAGLRAIPSMISFVRNNMRKSLK